MRQGSPGAGHPPMTPAKPRLWPMEKWLSGRTLAYNAMSTPWPPESPAAGEVGKTIYMAKCAVCHGETGEGDGPAARMLKTKPAKFASGVYKFRSTPTGFAPTDMDLFKTISRGVHGTAMVPWIGLTDSQKWLVIYHIKSLSDIFDVKGAPDPVSLPLPKSTAEEYVKMGKRVYQRAKCHECHGLHGSGDGPKAKELKDDWGRPIRPRNFRAERLKRGRDIEGIYLTVATGLNGTPMLSYSHVLSKDEMLSLAYYVHSLTPEPPDTVEQIKPLITLDEMAGLRIDHMQGIQFEMPQGFTLP